MIDVGQHNVWFVSDNHFGHGNIIKYTDRPFLDEQGRTLINKVKNNPTGKDFDAWKRHKVPSDCVLSHDEQLIENWNRCVGEEDYVFFLGDFCFGKTSYAESLLDRLNGYIYFMVGNHDHTVMKIKNRFEWFGQAYEISVYDPSDDERYYICMSHYAHVVWNKSHEGAFMLYGHTHNRLPEPTWRTMDVGVDAIAYRLKNSFRQKNHTHPKDYRPFSFHEVKKVMLGRDIMPSDPQELA